MLTRLLSRCRIRLTAEEEAQLAQRMHAGDRQARDLLVESVLPYIARLASRYIRPGFELDDLFQVGVATLLYSLESFDPAQGRLTTYCEQPVTWRLYRHVRTQGLIYRPYIMQPNYAEQHQRAATVGGLPEDAGRLIPAPDEDLAELEEQEHDRGRCDDALATLPQFTQRVFRRRLAGHTLKAIAADEQVTRECIRYHEQKAIRTIRQLVAA